MVAAAAAIAVVAVAAVVAVVAVVEVIAVAAVNTQPIPDITLPSLTDPFQQQTVQH
jgi:hypothetical protein